MKLSHSKLNTILSCPASYFLNYIEGIQKKEGKPAFAIGSAVHWGIEHNTEDLTEYYGLEHNYGHDEILSEAMIHGYLKHKDELFEQVLTNKDGTKLELQEETHELYIDASLKSNKYVDPHQFVGIIDLLLLTDKGFIIIDYKTSTYTPNWDNYLDQIYRYIFLLRNKFPDVPIVKIGIINIRKTGIRQKKNENNEQFLNRLRLEYDINDDALVNYHEFRPEDLDQTLLNNYITNLSRMADMAQLIDSNGVFYINFSAANGTHGKSDYWDIFYHTPDCEYLYTIRDLIYTQNNDSWVSSEWRDCNKLDMMVLDQKNILNHYTDFKKVYKSVITQDVVDAKVLIDYLDKNYSYDPKLISQYLTNVKAEKELNLF